MEDLFKKFVNAGVGYIAQGSKSVQKTIDKLVQDNRLTQEEGKKIVDELLKSGETKRAELEKQFQGLVERAKSTVGLSEAKPAAKGKAAAKKPAAPTGKSAVATASSAASKAAGAVKKVADRVSAAADSAQKTTAARAAAPTKPAAKTTAKPAAKPAAKAAAKPAAKPATSKAPAKKAAPAAPAAPAEDNA